MRSRKILTLKRNLNSSYTHVSRIYGFTLGNKAAHWCIFERQSYFHSEKFFRWNSSIILFKSKLRHTVLSTYFLLDEYTKKIYAILTYFSLKTKKNSSKSISVLESLLREGWAGPICLKHELNYSDQIGPWMSRDFLTCLEQALQLARAGNS